MKVSKRWVRFLVVSFSFLRIPQSLTIKVVLNGGFVLSKLTASGPPLRQGPPGNSEDFLDSVRFSFLIKFSRGENAGKRDGPVLAKIFWIIFANFLAALAAAGSPGNLNFKLEWTSRTWRGARQNSSTHQKAQ